VQSKVCAASWQYPTNALPVSAGALMVISTTRALIRRWRDAFDVRQQRIAKLRAAALTANSYSEWREYVWQMDHLEGDTKRQKEVMGVVCGCKHAHQRVVCQAPLHSISWVAELHSFSG